MILWPQDIYCTIVRSVSAFAHGRLSYKGVSVIFGPRPSPWTPQHSLSYSFVSWLPLPSFYRVSIPFLSTPSPDHHSLSFCLSSVPRLRMPIFYPLAASTRSASLRLRHLVPHFLFHTVSSVRCSFLPRHPSTLRHLLSCPPSSRHVLLYRKPCVNPFELGFDLTSSPTWRDPDSLGTTSVLTSILHCSPGLVTLHYDFVLL
jgi:hypothetical protein